MLAIFLKSLIRFYSWVISPLLRKNCRFAPSCSEYSYQAIERFGAIKGSCLMVKRVCRCHPWGGSGFDPVPEKSQSDENHDKSA